MTALKPNAAIRCAIIGRDQGTVRGNVGGDFLRLSCLSLLPTPASTLRPGTLATVCAEPFSALSGAKRPATAKRRTRLATRPSWRHDGLAMAARYRRTHGVRVNDVSVNDVQVSDAMPSQESPKSKALASA